MALPADWKTYKIPAGLAVAAVSAAVIGYSWLNGEFVHAADYSKDQVRQEVKTLTREQRALEDDIFQLEVKRDATPAKYDAVDRQVLERKKDRLKKSVAESERVKSTGKVSD